MGSNTILCPNCGNPNWEDSEACYKCGSKLPQFPPMPPITKEQLVKAKVIYEA